MWPEAWAWEQRPVGVVREVQARTLRAALILKRGRRPVGVVREAWVRVLCTALIVAQALLRGAAGFACPSAPVPASPLLPEVAADNSSVHGVPGDGDDGVLVPRGKIGPGTLL